MNAVDVLAVIDAIDGILNAPIAVKMAEVRSQQAALREARAAVAELIETSVLLRDILRNDDLPTSLFVLNRKAWADALNAAIARVRGEA